MLMKKLPPVQSVLFLVSRRASQLSRQRYDVIVVGGGHAGTEAAAAAARIGAETLLVTQKIQTIGALSCNPSLGGVGKGHLVREVDALDGLCGRAGDWAGINFSVLNRSKGPAVWGPRAQLDRQRYREFIQIQLFYLQAELLSTPRLTLLEGSVEELLVSDPNPAEPGRHRVTGIRLANSSQLISASSVVLTTGTFLSGSLFVGRTASPGGRMGDAPFMNTHTRCKPEEQLPCYLTYTTPGVERVVRESLHLNCHIQQDAKGPRYCPSIESRVLRFPGRSHQVWLEPEGLTSDLLYPQGLSMTMPPDVQLRLIREIPPLHRVEIHTPGYGVQYDYVCPTQLSPALQVKNTQGLFLAGQINGTTGYEEAAAQDHQQGPLLDGSQTTTPNEESYIGVLVDDLVSRGVTEPYRMFTSRAEFRTSLRPDNADLRLTMKGFELGCVSAVRHHEAVRVNCSLQNAIAALQALTMSSTSWRKKLLGISMSENKNQTLSGMDLLQYKDVSFEMLASVFPECLSPYMEFSQRLKIEAVYKPHYDQNKSEIKRIQREENMSLPQDVDYFTLPVSLSQEVREILDRFRPTTLGAATRLEGMTPAAIANLFKYVNLIRRQESTMSGKQMDHEEEGGEEPCKRNASLPQ
ncbi:hypothetical protein CCH79_00017495 [Gambusia affinis]|uniref:tRNA uridine 5-carboxymethylaminomethyl modification enzyme C-terminal subdomain domain-containing protein n=1 Tax=Gambusia affinis TaxID=33528 RepID=A0A315UYY8_GAMAF|nr:hypothetical protein CCH79_00017495 [Gambusia affinis]